MRALAGDLLILGARGACGAISALFPDAAVAVHLGRPLSVRVQHETWRLLDRLRGMRCP